MRTPPPTPTKKKFPAFPLFDSLLNEGVNTKGDLNPFPQCPATAPVLLFTEPSGHRSNINAHYQHRRNGSGERTSTISNQGLAIMEQKHERKEQMQDNVENRGQSSGLEREVFEPITLQDPPKSKLKRQLSIDTTERIEATRVHKRAYTQQQPEVHTSAYELYPRSGVRTDEVDGDIQSLIDKAISSDRAQAAILKDPRRITASTASESNLLNPNATELHSVRRSPQKQISHISEPGILKPAGAELHSLRVSPHKQRSLGISETPTCLADTYYAQKDRPPQSSSLYNLNEIGLTSPFMNTTPRSLTSHEKEVFVFPDSVSPRKLSPYKVYNEQIATSSSSTVDDTILRYDKHPRAQQNKHFQSDHTQHDKYPSERRRTLSREDADEEGADSNVTVPNYQQQHVSSKGFIWPKTVSITQASQFSAHVATAEANPRFALSNTPACRPTNYYESFEEDEARLLQLEREYARAKEIYGNPPREREACQMSPHSREVTEILRRATQRSISDVERSPNEKDIRDTNEDVRNRYERSISDPTYSPRQIRGILQKPSPLTRERGRLQADVQVQDVLSQDRRKDSWHPDVQADVRRRLFMKSDPYFAHQDQRRFSFKQADPVAHGSTDIPHEVMQFLHTRNFHPEVLENLKDILRRSGSSPSDPIPSHFARATSMQYDSTVEPTTRIRSDSFDIDMQRTLRERYQSEYGQGQSLRQATGSIRERQLGDIDVRLSCESIIERERRSQEEILRDLEHDGKDCKCSSIEDEIRMMAMDAYSKIRRADKSVESFNQFQNEINETNTNVYNSMRVLCGIKCLCKYGRTLEDIYSGSVVFRINCPNVDALLDLWEMYKSKGLKQQLNDAFVTDDLKEKFGCTEIHLKVSISWDEYFKCKHDLEKSLQTQIVSIPLKSPGLSVIHVRSRSEPASVSRHASQLLMHKSTLSPFRERFCSDSSVELSPRRAFQEINTGKSVGMQPHSPSRKYFSDNVFFSEEQPGSPKSPLSSPRRKTFGIKPQLEQENVDQTGSIVPPNQVTFQENWDSRISDV